MKATFPIYHPKIFYFYAIEKEFLEKLVTIFGILTPTPNALLTFPMLYTSYSNSTNPKFHNIFFSLGLGSRRLFAATMK